MAIAVRAFLVRVSMFVIMSGIALTLQACQTEDPRVSEKSSISLPGKEHSLPHPPTKKSPSLPPLPGLVVEDWAVKPFTKTGIGIPPNWIGQTWGSPKYDFRVEIAGPSRVLHLKSQNESSTISKEVNVSVKQYPILEWRWKAVLLPRGGDVRKEGNDDQAAQIYVVFPRFPSSVRSRIIGYVWDTTAPVGTIVKSGKTGTVTYIVVRSGAADRGKWITETRNVREDYKRLYSEEPDESVGSVSVAIDSNDTQSAAESYMGQIVFRRP